MKPHQLGIEAFGPYAERVSIDFDALSGEGLFLIHGSTGAGKTFLLDAMSFALFGEVSGDRSVKGLRSDHAAGRSWGKRGRTPVILASGQRFGCNMISAITNRGRLYFLVFKEKFTWKV